MTHPTHGTQIFYDGLWRNNAGLVPLLGLCPLLAVSTTLIQALALALATATVLVVTCVLVSCTRHWVIARVRLLCYVMIIAAAVTLVDQWMAATRFELYRNLGIFVPLIATNCAIFARAELFASRHGPGASLIDALATGLGFAAVLVSLGTLREIIGNGTLLSDADTLFGPAAASWRIEFADGFLLAALPPGAFFSLAALVALRRAIGARSVDDDAELSTL